MYHDADGRQCQAEAIQSHSLQKRGVLSSIAESGHVIHMGISLNSKSLSRLEPFERLGIQKASTFLGFCSIHDSTVFSEIETVSVPLNARTAFVFYLRNIAMELYRKRVMAALQIETIEHLQSVGRTNDTKIPNLLLKGANSAISEGEVRCRVPAGCAVI